MADYSDGAMAMPRTSERGGPPSRSRVGVLDADTGFVQVLVKRLEATGMRCGVLPSAPSLDALVSLRLSALVVDPSFLGPNAWSYLESICARMPNLGLIVCTPPASVAQRVRGLRLGADDWVTKPCHPEEVVARLESVIRRRSLAGPRSEQIPVQAGGLTVRPDHFQAFVGDVSADLTRREFELLQLLAGHAGQVMPREEIYERVWGYAMAHGDRSVDVFVRKLRQKLDRVAPGRRYIHTHFGIGYRFAAENPDAGAPDAAPAPHDGALLVAA